MPAARENRIAKKFLVRQLDYRRATSLGPLFGRDLGGGARGAGHPSCGVAAVPDDPEPAIRVGDQHFARPVHMSTELSLIAGFHRGSLTRVMRTVGAAFEIDPPLPATVNDNVKCRRHVRPANPTEQGYHLSAGATDERRQLRTGALRAAGGPTLRKRALDY